MVPELAPPLWYLRRIGTEAPAQECRLAGLQAIFAGRSPSCAVHCPSRFTSRRQCEFQYVAPAGGVRPCWCVRDLGSANGTFLDGNKLPAHEWRPLVPGQEVGLGGPALNDCELFVFAVEEADSTPASNACPDDDVIVISDEDPDESPSSDLTHGDPLGTPSAERTGNGPSSAERTGNGPLLAERTGNGCLSAERTGSGSSSAERTGNGPSSAERTGNGPSSAERTTEAGRLASKRGSAECTSPPFKRRRSNSRDLSSPTEADATVVRGGPAGDRLNTSDDDVVILESEPPPPPPPWDAAHRDAGSAPPQTGRCAEPSGPVAPRQELEASDALVPSGNDPISRLGVAGSRITAADSVLPGAPPSESGTGACTWPASGLKREPKIDDMTSAAHCSNVCRLPSVVPKKEPVSGCRQPAQTSPRTHVPVVTCPPLAQIKKEPKIEGDPAAASKPSVSGIVWPPAADRDKRLGVSRPPSAGPSGEPQPPQPRQPSGTSTMSDDGRRSSSSSDSDEDRLDLPSEQDIRRLVPAALSAYSQEDTVIEISDDDEEYFSQSQANPEASDSDGEDFDPRRRIKEEPDDLYWLQLDELDAVEPEEPVAEEALVRPRHRSPPPSPPEAPSAEELPAARPPLSPPEAPSAEELPAARPPPTQPPPVGANKRSIQIGSRTVHISRPLGPRIAETEALPLPPRGRRRRPGRSISVDERPPAGQRRRRRRLSETTASEAPPRSPSPPPPPPPISNQELRERRREQLKTVAERSAATQRASEMGRPKAKARVKMTGRSRSEQLAAEMEKVSFNRKSPFYRPASGRAAPDGGSAAVGTPPSADAADGLVPDYVPGITQRRWAHPVPAGLLAFSALTPTPPGGPSADPMTPPGAVTPPTASASATATSTSTFASTSTAATPAIKRGIAKTPLPATGPSSLRPAADRQRHKSVTFAPESQICKTQFIPAREPREGRSRPTPARHSDQSLWRIVSWRYGWLQEANGQKEPPPVQHEMTVGPTPLTYESHAHMARTLEPLMLHELWSKVAEDSRERDNPPRDVLLRISKLENTGRLSADRSSSAAVHSLVTAYCEAVVSTRARCHPEPGVLACLDLPQRASATPGRNTRIQVFAFVKDLRWQIPRNCEQMKRYVEERFAGLQLSEDLSAFRGARYTLLLRQRDTLKTIDWDRLIKLKSVSYIHSDLRLFNSLSQLERSPLLQAILRPEECPSVYSLPPAPAAVHHQDLLGSLNRVQRDVVCRVSLAVLKDRRAPQISVIHGPPGTGKTKVIACLVKHVLAAAGGDGRLLVCSPSNTAVDELTRRLVADRHQFKNGGTGRDLRLVRFGRTSVIAKDVGGYSLDSLVERNVSIRLSSPQNVREAEDIKERIATTQKKLSTADQAHIFTLQDTLKKLTERQRELRPQHTVNKKKIEEEERKKLLKGSNVITTTLASSYGTQLASAFQGEDVPFLCCIVDEAGQCTEPEALIPLEYGIRKLVLVGDHQQLPPTVTSQVATKHGLRRSLLERLTIVFDSSSGTSPVVMLRSQYRMHAEICRWPSARFYGDQLETHAPPPPPPLARLRPYLLLQTAGGSETSHAGGGFSNEHEAELVISLTETVASLCDGGERPPSVGIITPYQRQRRLIQEQLQRSSAKALAVDVSTVDGFQGQERDVIILSFVRSNFSGQLGFLADLPRLNVALTRAKNCLFMCGDFGTLSKNSDWNNLIQDGYRRQAVIKDTMGLRRNPSQLKRWLWSAAGSSGSDDARQMAV